MGNQARWVVGDDGVDAGVDEAVPFGRGVGSPGNDLKSGLAQGGDGGAVNKGVMGRGDGGGGVAGESDEVAGASGVESGTPDIGGKPGGGSEGAEIEGLDDDAAFQVVAADGVDEQASEVVRRGGEFGFGGRDFRFDIELEFAARGEGEHFVEGGDAGAGHGLLLREGGVDERAAVPAAEFGERHFADDAGGVGRSLAQRLGQDGVMGNHENVVAGDGEVEFEHVGAGFNGVLKRWQRVLRPRGAGAAVAVNQDFRIGFDTHQGHNKDGLAQGARHKRQSSRREFRNDE